MKRTIQRIAVLVLAVICMSFGIAGTVAYFTGSSDSHNVIETAPGVNLSVVETVNTGVLPGSTVSRKVAVEAANSSATAWVRVKVNKSIELAEGTGGEPNLDMVAINFTDGETDAKWQEKDGWWYYKDQLSAGQTTELLFDSINFDAWGVSGKYKKAKVIVSVQAQGVQVKNNGDTVLEAKGWPTESGN